MRNKEQPFLTVSGHDDDGEMVECVYVDGKPIILKTCGFNDCPHEKCMDTRTRTAQILWEMEVDCDCPPDFVYDLAEYGVGRNRSTFDRLVTVKHRPPIRTD